MPFAIPEGLAPEVYPLAWLVGSWRGHGTIGYPGVPAVAIEQHVVVDHDGGPYLVYSCVTWTIGEDGQRGPVWSRESGFWRVAPDGAERVQVDGAGPDGARGGAAPPVPVELLLADPSGHVSVYLGGTAGGRIDLASDLVARTATGAEIAAAARLYGLVDGELMWAWDLAAFGHPLQSYLSARLTRAEV